MALHDKSLLLFGCDFFTRRKTSEVNFWNDMVKRLALGLKRIVVLSVNNRPIRHERLNDNVYLYNLSPHYFGNTKRSKDPEYTGSRFHRLPMAVAYKTYSFVRYQSCFDRLLKVHEIDIVHYMRIFGLLNELLIRRHPEVLYSITVPTHIDRGYPLHGFYHSVKLMGLAPMDKVIPTSRATGGRLLQLGLGEDKLEVIHWSLEDETDDGPNSTVAQVRAELGIPMDSLIVLWSGPLQHTGASEFFHALSVAIEVVRNSKHIYFVFAFKPDELKPAFLEAVSDSSQITVLETNRLQFQGLKRTANLFLSPVCNNNRTVAPPLTWIEMMHCETPVITSDVPGVSELINHMNNGFVVDGVEETAQLLLSLRQATIRDVGRASRRSAMEQYSIDDIAAQYLTMWNTALCEKRTLAPN